MKKIIRSAWEEDEWGDESGETIYDEETRQNMIDDGEIDLWELAFMEGWDSAQ